MSKYQFTGETPMIFSTLSFGEGVTVERFGDEPVGEDGATVELFPGDTITLDEPIEHAWLKDTAGDASGAGDVTPSTPNVPGKVETPAAAKITPQTADSADPETAAVEASPDTNQED